MEKIPTPYYSHPTLHGLTRTRTHTHTHTHTPHTHHTTHPIIRYSRVLHTVSKLQHINFYEIKYFDTYLLHYHSFDKDAMKFNQYFLNFSLYFLFLHFCSSLQIIAFFVLHKNSQVRIFIHEMAIKHTKMLTRLPKKFRLSAVICGG